MAPTLVAAISPFLNSINVGIPRTPNLVGVSGLSSILTFATTIVSLLSAASSSRYGAIILHGPHHSAQKSTTTGTGDFSTSASNEASLVIMTGILVSPWRVARAALHSRLGGGRRERQADLVTAHSEFKTAHRPWRAGPAASRRASSDGVPGSTAAHSRRHGRDRSRAAGPDRRPSVGDRRPVPGPARPAARGRTCNPRSAPRR